MLESFDIRCTTFTIFKIGYTDGQLCECGSVERPDKTLTRNCQLKLSQDINLQLSVNEVRRVGENCTMNFNYTRLDQPHERRIFSIWEKFSPDEMVTQSFVLPHSVTRTSIRFITSYITTIVGLPSATSSLLPSLSELRINFTMASTQIRLVRLLVLVGGIIISKTHNFNDLYVPIQISMTCTEIWHFYAVLFDAIHQVAFDWPSRVDRP